MIILKDIRCIKVSYNFTYLNSNMIILKVDDEFVLATKSTTFKFQYDNT